MKALCLLAAVLSLSACDTGRSQPANSPNSSESTRSSYGSSTAPPDESQDPRCLGESGSERQCLADNECCTGFYCGIDPGGSNRIKVCLYNGK